MPRHIADHKARSPYARYGKTPYRYSDAYAAWRRALLTFGTDDPRTQEARAEHNRFVRYGRAQQPVQRGV